MEAFITLHKEQSVDLDSIERISVFAPPQYRAMIDRGARPTTKMESRGVRYQLAIAAYYPQDLFDVDRQRLRTDDPNVCRLMDAIEVKDSKSFGALYPRSWPAGIAVHTRAKTLELGVHHAKGDPERPLTWSEIDLKLQSISKHCGSPFRCAICPTPRGSSILGGRWPCCPNGTISGTEADR